MNFWNRLLCMFMYHDLPTSRDIDAFLHSGHPLTCPRCGQPYYPWARRA